MNVLTANTICTAANEFADLVEFAKLHEEKHVAAIKAEAAKHDLPASWEPVTGKLDDVKAEAARIATSIDNAIDKAADWTHTAGPIFDVWWWDSDVGWYLRKISTKQ